MHGEAGTASTTASFVATLGVVLGGLRRAPAAATTCVFEQKKCPPKDSNLQPAD